MAEKKFFVDINLQGSALTNAKIGTNSGIGSTEGAFGYDSSAHRLQYFDGTATKEVANLSDIAAVTGGLIFQGGYDPTTNTPDITDGTALKGYFWAATAAGTFLGESVQVGDSIVAKVDNAGTNLSDWLILQGNVVVATETVDGISRLATQTEVNAGTEAGAVVLTPATFENSQQLSDIRTDISNLETDKLSRDGSQEMTGVLQMGGWGITQLDSIGRGSGSINLESGLNAWNLYTIENLPAPTNDGDATNKLYVDNASNDKLPLAGGTMSGSINMGNNSIVGINTIYANVIGGVGNTIRLGNNLDADGASIINLPAPTDGGDATNKTYVDTTASTAESNANAYTDTEIAALAFLQTIASADWYAESDGTYSVSVTHNLNAVSPNVTTYLRSVTGEYKIAEFEVLSMLPDLIQIYSNVLPSTEVNVRVSK